MCKTWFFTYNGTKEAPPCHYEVIIAKLKALKPAFFRFSLERGEDSGLLHYQGVVGFDARKRNNTLQLRCWKGYWAKCQSPKDAVDYCGKESTHVEGPWDYGLLPGSRTYRTGFKPELQQQWQTDLFKMIDETPDTDIPKRTIYWFWSENGARGKSSTVAELEDNHACMATEMCDDAQRNLYSIAARADPLAVGSKQEQDFSYKGIIIDVPRSSLVDYTMLETLCGERFSNTFQRPCRVRLFPCYKIVFANYPPNCDPSIISGDRFVIKCVD